MLPVDPELQPLLLVLLLPGDDDDPCEEVDCANTAMLPVAKTTAVAISVRRAGEIEGCGFIRLQYMPRAGRCHGS